MANAANPNETIVGEYRVIEDKAHRLGAGSGGTVYRAEHVTIENKFAAAKKTTIHKEYIKTGEFEKEADLLMNKIPGHKNIIKVYNLTKEEYVERGVEMIDIWLLMEYAPLGSLNEFAQENSLSIEQKVELMFQCALGVKHLHDCKPEPIAHRDIKPQNIVITGSVDNPIPRICDFGSGKTVLQRSGRSVTLTSLSGTASYAAPEQTQLQDGKFAYNKSVDIFSLGVTFESLLECTKGKAMTPKKVNERTIGQAMWDFKKAMMEYSTAFGVPKFSLQIDHPSDGPLEKAIKDIIKQMIQLEPSDRIAISEVVERLSVLRTSTPSVKKPSEVRVSTPKLIAVKGNAAWVKKGSAWEELSGMPVPDGGVCYGIVSDGIVAVSGQGCWHFSLLTECWEHLTSMAEYRGYAAVVVLLDMMLVMGGEDIPLNTTATCERFHFSNPRWSPAASMKKPLWRPLVAAAAGKAFVVPRSLTISPDTQLQEYDPERDEFSEAAPLPQHVEHTYGACLVGTSDKLYLLGGVQKLAVEYSPDTREWVELSPPSASYDTTGCCGAVHDGKLLLFGGSSDSDHHNMVEQYDLHTQQWETADFTLPFSFNLENSLVGIVHV